MLKAQNCTKTSVNGCVRQVLATEGSLFYSPFPPPPSLSHPFLYTVRGNN